MGISIRNRIKRIVTRKGRVMYYRGDGLWFGRCGRTEAELALAMGTAQLWETTRILSDGTRETVIPGIAGVTIIEKG